MPSRTIRSNLRQTIIRQDKAVRKELREEMGITAQDMADWLTVAANSMKLKVRFAPRVEILPDRLRAFVDIAGTGKKIFVYIDKGTGKYGPKKKAYPIPKPGNTSAKTLKFQRGYSPKTAPGARINVGTGKRSGKWVSKVRVIHPGIKPRDFTKTVGKELKPSFDKRVDAAIRRGLRKAR